MTTLPTELVERLNKRAAECSSASCHDDKDRFLNVVAKLTRSDGRLMAEAAAEISSLRAQVASLQKELAERTAERDAANADRCFHTDDDPNCKMEASFMLMFDRERERAEAAESRADTLARRVEGLEAALRDQFCPRPCNGRPDKFDVGDCVDAGECGCSARAALTGERP
jgi:hypothetical protein